jgi:glycosyltransferase involved in cell wall biosynthesis
MKRDPAMTLSYVLITPARNEADYIEKTIESVISQTVLPLRWIIVSDGSTDGTDAIVQKYLPGRPWIELIQLPPRAERNFAAKVYAVRTGQARMADLDYEVIVNVDGDVSFPPDYFEYLVRQFETDPQLGCAGTHYIEGDFHSFTDSYINVHHVNGQIQAFRRRCFDDIGGYQPVTGGGIDWIAVTTARMKGWKTYSFGERVFHHHRPMGTAGGSVLEARFHYGKKDYFLGGHPLWQIARSTFQITKSPYVIGGLALLAGYVWSWVRGLERPVSPELMKFHRGEQMARLRGLIFDRFGLRHNEASPIHSETRLP